MSNYNDPIPNGLSISLDLRQVETGDANQQSISKSKHNFRDVKKKWMNYSMNCKMN